MSTNSDMDFLFLLFKILWRYRLQASFLLWDILAVYICYHTYHTTYFILSYGVLFYLRINIADVAEMCNELPQLYNEHFKEDSNNTELNREFSKQCTIQIKNLLITSCIIVIIHGCEYYFNLVTRNDLILIDLLLTVIYTIVLIFKLSKLLYLPTMFQ